MRAWTALGTKSRIRVALTGWASGAGSGEGLAPGTLGSATEVWEACPPFLLDEGALEPQPPSASAASNAPARGAKRGVLAARKRRENNDRSPGARNLARLFML